MYMLDAIPNLVHGLDQTKSIERCTLLRCQKRLIKTYEDAKTKYFTHSAAVTSPEVVETAAETATEIIKAVGLRHSSEPFENVGKEKDRTPIVRAKMKHATNSIFLTTKRLPISCG